MHLWDVGGRVIFLTNRIGGVSAFAASSFARLVVRARVTTAVVVVGDRPSRKI